MQDEPIDVLVSDISLPDGSGIDLMRQMRQMDRQRSAHGIALTGLSMAEDIRRCYDAGFSKHLAKPINLGLLEEVIQQLAGEASEAASSDPACRL